MSNHPTLGTPAPSTLTKDAIHVAVVPACAGVALNPGDKVTIDRNRIATKVTDLSWIGVVDPMRDGLVPRHQWFWLLLRPGAVQNLRHEWDHPAITEPEPVAEQAEVEYDECSGC